MPNAGPVALAVQPAVPAAKPIGLTSSRHSATRNAVWRDMALVTPAVCKRRELTDHVAHIRLGIIRRWWREPELAVRLSPGGLARRAVIEGIDVSEAAERDAK